MDGEGQKETGQPKEESGSLKQFSDTQLLKELEERLLINPKVDPVIAQKLQSIAAELQKKAEVANTPSVEPEKPVETSAPAVDPKLENSAESSVESEGKKWAKIIREKGVGYLSSKFRPEWKYLGEDGKYYPIVEKAWIGFRRAGEFGAKDDSEYNAMGYTKRETDIINSEYHGHVPTRANFLWVQSLGLRTDRFSNGMIFAYYSWLSSASCPDPRGGVAFEFRFVLPQKEKEEFLSVLKKDIGLIESVFQSVYPGLTGENGAKLMKVDKLKLIGPNTDYKDYERGKLPESRISHPIGKIPWPTAGRERF